MVMCIGLSVYGIVSTLSVFKKYQTESGSNMSKPTKFVFIYYVYRPYNQS